MILTTPLKATVVRLVSILKGSPADVFLSRGIQQQSIAEILVALAGTGIPFTATEILEDTFISKPGFPTPFPIGRYGAGQFPVYYCCISENTAEAEVGFHLRQMVDWISKLPKHYCMLGCTFDGEVVDISDCAIEFPDLVSQSKDGYAFCQKLSEEFRVVADAVLAPSARDLHIGKCVPTYNRSKLSQPTVMYYAYFARDKNGSLVLMKRS